MDMKAITPSGAICAAVAALAICCAHAETACITGAEYEMTGSALTVSSGEGTLVAQLPAEVTDVTVAEGASLSIGVDNPFASSPILRVHGTLDLNGRSFAVDRIANILAADALRTVPGRIVNTSQTGVTLTLDNGSATSQYYGTIEELPGKIEIASANATTWLRSPTVDAPVSSLTSDKALRILDRPGKVKFVLYPSDESKPVRLGEIQPTSSGFPVVVTEGTATSGDGVANLHDGQANTFWQATETGVQTVVLSLKGFPLVDGYRISPYDGQSQDTSYRPSGWDVYIQRSDVDNLGWTLVDSRRNFEWYSRQMTTSSTNILFSAKSRPGAPFGEDTDISLSSTPNANRQFRISANDVLTAGSLSGALNVRIEDGSTFAPGNLSGYTAAFESTGTSADSNAKLALSSRGGAEQPISVTSPQNLTVKNGGDATVSVLLDDSRAGEHLFGRLADGESGKLGLVKRGSGERTIETEDCSYTGPTVVYGGVLTVARRRTAASVSARYIKITPTATHGTYNSGYPWGMNEFVICDETGAAVPWPENSTAYKLGTGGDHSETPMRLIDGDVSTRMLVKADASGKYAYPPVVIDATAAGVRFSSYSWYSPHGNSIDVNRTPVAWTVEVSNDNATWAVCDKGEFAWSAEDGAATAFSATAPGVERGPFIPGGAATSPGSGLYTLPERYFAAGSARDTHRKLKAQYFMLAVYETCNPDRGRDSWGWQLSEISLLKDGQRVEWPAETTSAIYGSVVYSGARENLHNNVLEYGDGSSSSAERTFVRTMPSFVIINAHKELEFDSYSFTSTSYKDSQNDRLPSAWKLGISNSSGFSSFSVVDSVSGYVPGGSVLTESYQEVGPFPLSEKWPLLDMGAGDSIGDRSPVAIHQGATLRLSTDYEKFGPLSGAGTLDLQWGATGEINACADATFSGTVAGSGTLVLSGTGTQSFSGATLSGVKTLELNGGTIAGTASFGGNDVAVSFGGGATCASLSGIGALSVSGDVRYSVPELPAGAKSFSAILFSARSISAESQALLEAGTFDDTLLRQWQIGVKATDATVTISGFVSGTVLIVR